MKRIDRPVRASNQTHRRSGLTTPAVAVAFLVIMTGIALIIDRIWLETAKLELRTAAESAALAAAGDLACDVLLQPNVDMETLLENARESAAFIASQNVVCGSPVILNTEPGVDIQFGQFDDDPSGNGFTESTDNPNTVVVIAQRTHSKNNPIALFISGASGLAFGDVATRVAASVNNDIYGLRPNDGSSIPALPIAIWQNDPEQKRKDTWKIAIEAHQGADQYAFDPDTRSVVPGADGIPELMIQSLRTGGETSDPNMVLLDLGTGFGDVEVDRQFQSGISVDDLQELNGEILLGQGATLQLNATQDLSAAQSAAFQDIVGQQRICFLYSSSTPQSKPHLTTTTCTEIVAVRIMAVNVRTDGSCDITVQPTVMISRTSMIASDYHTTNATGYSNSTVSALGNGSSSNTVSNVVSNRYLYKLQLTH